MKPVPLEIQLKHLRFSATLRVELKNLMDTFPCFGAIDICLVRKPFIDLSLKIGNLDVMNLPSGTTEPHTNLVGDIIQNIVKDLLVYPKKMTVMGGGNKKVTWVAVGWG